MFNRARSILGLGWRQCQTPTPPFALVMFLDIDWDETNKQHKLTCQLLDTDGQPVVVQGPQGPQRILFEAAAEAGRLPGSDPRHRGPDAAHPQHPGRNPLNRASTSGGSRWTASNRPPPSRPSSCPRAASRRRRHDTVIGCAASYLTNNCRCARRRTSKLGSQGPTSAASISVVWSSSRRSTI